MIDIPVYSIHGIPVAVKTPAPLTSREGITVNNYINHLCVWNPALQDWTNINNIVAVGTVNSGYEKVFNTKPCFLTIALQIWLFLMLLTGNIRDNRLDATNIIIGILFGLVNTIIVSNVFSRYAIKLEK